MEDLFHINARDPTPLYAQLERAIRFAIATGRLKIGEQLPTVRQLAVDLRINANTVAKVYAELERGGIVETRRGVGTFVRARHFEAARRSDHERELRALADRFLTEAAALGFSPQQVLEYLSGKLKKETGTNG
jgi:GntR family transcriptional regulator